ncbi:MAG: tetratricopeptide repeat protein [Opitutaceae bacterium]|jgi:tetratricopeptide (TPR) repeat protein
MSRRLSQLLTLALVQSLFAGAAFSQTFYFSDGRKASMPEAKTRGTNIVVPLKVAGTDGGSASVTLPISSLARIEWPAPAAIADAEADLKADKPADALKKIDAILPEQELFRDIPGSWWNQGAVVKAVALARLGKDVDAGVMLERMRRAKAPAEDISRGEVAIIDQLVVAGKTDDATARLEKLSETVTDDGGLAAIAITKGRIFERAGKTQEALLSYLRVPVFYPSEEDKMPAALLGAARAYKKLGDEARAASTLATLSTRFPNSPEAAQAKL